MLQWRSLIRELVSDRGEPLLGGVVTMPPGYEDDPEAVDLARFAAEHNRNNRMWLQNAAVEFERLLKVRQQVVAGLMHYFTIEAREGGARKLYKAKVLDREWEKYRGLHHFKQMGNNTLYNRLRHFHAYKLLPEMFED